MDLPGSQHGPRAPPEPAAYRFRGFAGNSNDLASTYQLMGREEEVHASFADYRLARPNHTLKSVRAHWFGLSDNGLYLATRERQLAALRRLGLPEK